MAALARTSINRDIWKDYLQAQRSVLPQLKPVEDLTDRVIRIMGQNPGEMQLQGTNTYLLGTGNSRILVDTGEGVPLWAENITRLLKERDLTVSHILLTHWHGDHTGGIPDLIKYNPEMASRVYKNQPDPGQLPIEDKQVFRTHGATVQAIFTPGHAFDHMSFLLQEENALFTGDNVLGHGYSVCEDLGAYTHSLHTMQDQHCAVGYPAHGIKIEDLPRVIKQYIHHKERREKQIWTALIKGRGDSAGKVSFSAKELIHMVHGQLPADLVEMALEPFTVQVLWKLAEEGKISFELVGGKRKWFVKPSNIGMVTA
ncbi:metallo-beta-lactamase superfamily protein [Tothia fuscella]|uniref:Metallo-beta-lactamase superfamily protein n=1 Tax=Tothia fuscella TaxID=1048955 RepID=A0A9P4NGH0_9PEZI|nr:metallo-beta-lactamase superfamily protein [Tothia fuscella]